MRILFVGVGLTDYIVQLLNKLAAQQGVEIYNLVDEDGVGHVATGSHQTRKGLRFEVAELQGRVVHNYTDHGYRGFVGLPALLEKIQPNVLVVGYKMIKPFLYDEELKTAIKKLGIKIIMVRNPFMLEPYHKVRDDIISGRHDGVYTPPTVFYILMVCEKLGISIEPVKKFLLRALEMAGLYRKETGRHRLLARLDEEKHMLNFVDAHASYIEEAYELYGSYGVPREKIFIIYNSPDTDILFAIREKIEKEPPILPPNPHRFLHVGRLVAWKRVDLLIESLAVLKRSFTDAELVVVGNGPELKNLKTLTKKLGVKESVYFVGGVYDPAVLGKYFLSSSVYVLGGMGGISINDAMAFGRPIICSVCDGTEKKLVYEGHNGMYFKNGDGKDLTEKLRYLFAHPELQKKMGENSTEIIKTKINIHTIVSAYMKVFVYVLGRTSA